MPLQVEAVYEDGVLRPLEPLDLREHERVVVTVTKAAPQSPRLDTKYIERVKLEARASASVPDLEEVRLRLAKISGSLAADIVAERGER